MTTAKRIINRNFVRLLTNIDYQAANGRNRVWYYHPLSRVETDYLQKSMQANIRPVNRGLINRISWLDTQSQN